MEKKEKKPIESNHIKNAGLTLQTLANQLIQTQQNNKNSTSERVSQGQ